MSEKTPQAPGLLEVRKCSLRFGGLAALTDVSLRIDHGELVGLIGPNGAGKTSLFNILTGVYRPTEGEILLEGRSCVGLPPHRINNLGVARTFQNIRLFGSLNVRMNVRTSFIARLRNGLVHTVRRGRAFRTEEEEIQEEGGRLLQYFGLQEAALQPSRSLPYGDQRRLEIVRALATKPRLLLLDEPAAGMNPAEKEGLKRLIGQIRSEFGTAILLVEHDMKVVMGICERIIVLDQGRVISEGLPGEVRGDPKVIAAYLGESHAADREIDHEAAEGARKETQEKA
jgi:branched-chain amino acid transport system ATP-binding protein